MVMEAQVESGVFVSQNTGGPLNVTKMLAATSKFLFSVPTTSAQCRFANCTYMQKSEDSCPRTPSTLKRDLRREERRDFDARQCPKGGLRVKNVLLSGAGETHT